MDDPQLETEKAILSTALTCFTEEYSGLCDIWSGLETKAQGTITSSGIFIAGMLAFAKDLTSLSSTPERWVITATLACLIAAVWNGIESLTIREVLARPDGETLDQMIQDALENGRSHSEVLREIIREQSAWWKEVNSSVRQANIEKSLPLLYAQRMLHTAIICAGIAVTMRVWQEPHGIFPAKAAVEKSIHEQILTNGATFDLASPSTGGPAVLGTSLAPTAGVEGIDQGGGTDELEGVLITRW